MPRDFLRCLVVFTADGSRYPITYTFSHPQEPDFSATYRTDSTVLAVEYRGMEWEVDLCPGRAEVITSPHRIAMRLEGMIEGIEAMLAVDAQTFAEQTEKPEPRPVTRRFKVYRGGKHEHE